MAAILTKATGHGGMTVSAHLAEFFTEIGSGRASPSSSRCTQPCWACRSPPAAASGPWKRRMSCSPATDVQMNLGWTVQIYNIAEALPNLINPVLYAAPLAASRLRARDLVGFMFLQSASTAGGAAARVAFGDDVRLRSAGCRLRSPNATDRSGGCFHGDRPRVSRAHSEADPRPRAFRHPGRGPCRSPAGVRRRRAVPPSNRPVPAPRGAGRISASRSRTAAWATSAESSGSWPTKTSVGWPDAAAPSQPRGPLRGPTRRS